MIYICVLKDMFQMIQMKVLIISLLDNRKSEKNEVIKNDRRNYFSR